MRQGRLNGRLFVACLALIVASGGIIVAAIALGSSGDTRGRARADRDVIYVASFPLEPTPVEGQPGYYQILVTTNLPEGTLADVEYTDPDGGGGGCCTPVIKGSIEIPLINNRCSDLKGSDVSIQIVLAPDPSLFLHGPRSPRPQLPQPESVLAVLGANFENLNGPDVEERGNTRILNVTHEYQLPLDTCIKG